MGRRKKEIPKYGTVTLNGIEYFRTRIEDADGKRVALYAKTAKEIDEKVKEAKRQIEEASFRREPPTVAEYCERWVDMQAAHVRFTTLRDYKSKINQYIVKPLGHMYMANVTADDVKLALIPASKKSTSVYRQVHMLFKAIFHSAIDSNIIDSSPCTNISAKGGAPQKEREALSDEQVNKLLTADRKSTRLNSHANESRMPSSA